MEEKKLIEFRNIVKSFDTQVVLKGINLDIYENEFVTLLGPSGCGKTTLLRILGGFLDADEGKVIFDNEDITDKPPYERELNTVFQKYALFPHLSVYENIAFGLKLKKMSKDIIDQKVMKMLKLIGLEGYEDKNTTLLSGGQQQRVALARILACEPELLLLDEPFSALDSYLKEELQFELKQHLREFGKTTIIVSHDRDEIYKLCDRTMVMGQGEILVSKDTKELFEQPERVIAARLTGCKNISRAKKCGMHKVYAMDWGVELTVDRKVSEKITHVGIRAHDFHPADASSHDSENKIPVAVDREVRAPFEWTILFRNRENPKENMWMKMEREQTQIPQWVQVDPKRILLLEE